MSSSSFHSASLFTSFFYYVFFLMLKLNLQLFSKFSCHIFCVTHATSGFLTVPLYYYYTMTRAEFDTCRLKKTRVDTYEKIFCISYKNRCLKILPISGLETSLFIFELMSLHICFTIFIPLSFRSRLHNHFFF